MAHRDRRRSFRPRCEPLDGRVLPSAAPTVAIQDRVLFVFGTDDDDVIDVTIRPFRSGGRQIPVVRVSGIPRWFPATRFDLVAVAAGAGDDRVTVDDRGIPLLPVWLDGGLGNDTLVGGSGNDTILGGPGDDVIEARGPGTVIDGGPGRNVINGIPDPPPPPPIDDPAPPPDRSAAFPGPPLFIHPEPVAPPTSTLALTPDEWAIVHRTNQAREGAGLAPLVVNDRLQRAARIHALNMASLNRLAHDLPGTDAPTLADRARAVGYPFATIAENIAFNYRSPGEAVEGWLGSTGHRSNILARDVTEIGVAIALNSIGQPYYVQVFGSPIA